MMKKILTGMASIYITLCFVLIGMIRAEALEKIAFVSIRYSDDSGDIFVMNDDGTQPVNLTNSSMLYGNLAVSPDGEKIAFSKNSNIFSINRDGSNLTQLTNNTISNSNPEWSPDGERIAYVASASLDTRNQIMEMNRDGSNPSLLTDLHRGFGKPNLAWSPDGKQIAFSYSDDKIFGDTNIWLLNLDGTLLTKLTDDPETLIDDETPCWSPDGSKIAFSRNGDIYTINADGSNMTPLTEGGYFQQPAWSPDGSRITFSGTKDEGDYSKIYTMDANGERLVQLMSSSSWNLQSPVWLSPRIQNLSSSTHPNPTEWYNNNAPIISWTDEEPADLYLYTIVSSKIDNISSASFIERVLQMESEISIEKEVHLSGIDNGAWIIWVGRQIGNELTYLGRFPFNIDASTEPPSFLRIVDSRISTQIYQPVDTLMVSFSDIDYEMLLDGTGENSGYKGVFAAIDQNPTAITDKNSGNSLSYLPGEITIPGETTIKESVEITDGAGFYKSYTSYNLGVFGDSTTKRIRFKIDEFRTELNYDLLLFLDEETYIAKLDPQSYDEIISGDKLLSLSGNISAGWTEWIEVDGKVGILFISDTGTEYDGFMISEYEYEYEISAIRFQGSFSVLSEGLNFIHSFAEDSLGNLSDIVHFPIIADYTPPPIVEQILAFSLSDGDVILKWNEVEDAETGIAFYRIYRSTREGEIGTQINEDEATRDSPFRDLSKDNGGSLFPSLEYFYTIKAVNRVGVENSATHPQVSSKSFPEPIGGSVEIKTQSNYLSPSTSFQVDISGEFPVSGIRVNEGIYSINEKEIDVDITGEWSSTNINDSATPWTTRVMFDTGLDAGKYNVTVNLNEKEIATSTIEILKHPPVLADSVRIKTTPDLPTIGDEISFLISGAFPIQNAAIGNTSVNVEGSSIKVDISTEWMTGIINERTKQWETEIIQPSLNAGEYTVTVLIDGLEIASLPLLVAEGPPPEGPISIDCNPAPNDQEQRSTGNAEPEYVFNLQLYVKEAPEISGWSANIEYDSTQLRYVNGSFQASDFIPGMLALVDEKDGMVGVGGTVLGSDVQNSGDAELGMLSFEVLDEFADSTEIAITRISFRRADGIEDKRTVRHVVTVTSESVAGALAGDFDGSGGVDFSDFFMFADAFGGTDPFYDLSGDGKVDFDDFFVFADNFGKEAQAKLIALAEKYIGLPPTPRLEQNFPNPFNSSTTISYRIIEMVPIRLDIYDLTGQKIRTLAHGVQQMGVYRVRWDGNNDLGDKVSTGIYLARLQTGDFAATKKMTLVK
jgi:hypothetical protein